jgi:cytochrome d ubiquinol oxidase subunit II
MVSSTNHAYNLTVYNTASGAYSLKAMTVVVIIFLPLVLGYQSWTYYVFRKRVSSSDFRPAPEPSSDVTPPPARSGEVSGSPAAGDARPGPGAI